MSQKKKKGGRKNDNTGNVAKIVLTTAIIQLMQAMIDLLDSLIKCLFE